MGILRGIAVSSGIARGTAIILACADRAAGTLRRVEASQVQAEIARFEAALDKASAGGTFFVGHPEPVTPRKLLETIQQALGRRGSLVHVPMSVTHAAAEVIATGVRQELDSTVECGRGILKNCNYSVTGRFDLATARLAYQVIASRKVGVANLILHSSIPQTTAQRAPANAVSD